MRQPIRIPQRHGKHSRQAHCDLPPEAPYEREMGQSGFFGPTTHFHHKHPPTGWSSWDGPLRPRAYDLRALESDSSSPWDAPVILRNAHCEMRYWHLSIDMQALARNADGDLLLFVHAGGGDLYCDFGHLRLVEGDYVLLPRGTMWRLETHETLSLLMIEATNDHFGLPDKGMAGPHAIFDPAVLDLPQLDQAFVAQQTEDPWTIEIKRSGQISKAHYDYNPLDALGWHGDLCAVRLNWRAIRPLMSHRYHLPPSVHSTFVASRFVVCTFVPRPIESDPGALKVPFFHNNDDFDEVIFYHAGDFFSRDHIEPGMLTFHPAGFTHGPHPKAFAAGTERKRDMTDEVAVMVDARDALHPGAALDSCENPDYVHSWKSP
ncbi:MAG: homogentisate 1,2-dioxygenase [Oceanococcaceae bacterium]